MSGALRLAPWSGDYGLVAPTHGELAARTIAILSELPRPEPWVCYLARAGGEVVGTCAFKAPPDREGTVEIAYMTFPRCERRGHASAMIGALVAIARRGGAAVVIAHTRPHMGASAGALLRNGFARADAFDDPDDGPVWYWERVLDPAAA